MFCHLRSWIVRMRADVTLLVAVLGLPGTGAGAAENPDALPPGAVARFCWSPLHIGYGAAFAFAADGRTVVAVTPYGELRRFDAQTGRLLERRQVSDHSDVNLMRDCSVQISTDGQTLAIYESGFAGPRVTVYEVASGKKIFRREPDKSLLLFGRLSPNGKQLAVVEWPYTGHERNLRLIDLKTGHLSEIGTYGQYQIGVYFSADGKRLLVSEPAPQKGGSWGRAHTSTIDFFDPTSGKKIWRRSAWGTNFAISRDGRIIVSSGYRDQALKESGFHILRMKDAWDKPTEEFLRCFDEDKGGIRGSLPFTTLLLARDDRTIVTQQFGEVYLWDLQTHKEIRRFPMSKDVLDDRDPLPLALSADSRRLLANVKYLQCWDLKTGKPAFTPPDDSLPDYLIQLAFAPDGKEVFASTDKGLSKWNLAAGKRIDLTPDRRQFDYPFVRTPDGLRAIVKSSRNQWGKPDKVTVLDPVSRKTLHSIRVNAADGLSDPEVADAWFTAYGKVLVVLYRGKKFLPSAAVFMSVPRVAALEVATGRKLSDFALTTSSPLAQAPVSPCGRWVMLQDKLYHVGNGTELFKPAGSRGEWMNFGDMNVWFSEDGRLLATTIGTYEEKWPRAHTLAVWELASGKILARFPKPGVVAQVAFLPDDRTIVLLDAQGLRLEDSLSGKQLARYAAPDVICDKQNRHWIQPGFVCSPDGGTLATAHEDGSIVLWKVPRSGTIHPAPLADGEAEKLWTDLGSTSPMTARTAVERLARHPDAASALLATHFRPLPADAKLTALIDDLDSDKSERREEAARQIRTYGAKAEPALRRTLTKAPSLEIRRRIENLLAEIAPAPLHLPLSGDRLRGVRAIEVLERAGNVAARSLLQSWSEQTQDVHLAIEARLALERLGPAPAK
jgi:WD40 repeat protein